MTADAAPQGVPFPVLAQANDLGDPAVVELLVRSYTDRALEVFQAISDGRRDLNDGAEEIGAQAEVLNGLFLGLTELPGVAIRPWNAPEQLGVYLRDIIGLDFPPQECVRAGLIHLATLMMHAIQASPGNWQDEVEAMRLEMRDLLLGVRPMEPDAGSDLPMA